MDTPNHRSLREVCGERPNDSRYFVSNFASSNTVTCQNPRKGHSFLRWCETLDLQLATCANGTNNTSTNDCVCSSAARAIRRAGGCIALSMMARWLFQKDTFQPGEEPFQLWLCLRPFFSHPFSIEAPASTLQQCDPHINVELMAFHRWMGWENTKVIETLQPTIAG